MNNRRVVALVSLLAVTGGFTATSFVLGYRFEYMVASLIGSLLFVAVVIAVGLERQG